MEVDLVLVLSWVFFCVVSIFFFYKQNVLRSAYKSVFNEKGRLEIALGEQNILLEKCNAEKLELEMLALVSEQSESGIMLMDAEGNIKWVNDAFERMYEYKFEEFIETLGDNIRKTSFNPKITERLNRCQKEHKSVIYEALNITKTGGEIWTHTSLIPLVKDGILVGMVTVDSDIHKRVVNTEHLIVLMEQIKNQIDNLDGQFQVLITEITELFQSINRSKELIEKTDKIVLHIKGVSDETRIIGLNASIEASNAGNTGNGFRVIANEIVQISHNTVESAKEILMLIDNLKSGYQQLRSDRRDSQTAFQDYQKLMAELKSEVQQIENRLENFNAWQ
jgi:PAS domain S-box-containing protein